MFSNSDCNGLDCPTIEHTWFSYSTLLDYNEANQNYDIISTGLSNTCFQVNSNQRNRYWHFNREMLNFTSSNFYSSSEFNIHLAGWEDDNGSRCSFDNNDDDYCSTGQLFNLIDFPPFDWRDVPEVSCGNYRVRYQVMWEAPPLTKPVIENTSGCANTNFNLHVSGLFKYEKFNDYYRWEVQYDYNHDAIFGPWELLDTTSSDTLVILLPEVPETSNWVNARYRVIPIYENGAGCSSTISDILKINPSAPQTVPFQTTNISCFGDNNGALNIEVDNIVGGRGTPNFAIRNQNTGFVWPVGGVNYSGVFENLPPGVYTLAASNPPSAGQCYSTDNFAIYEPNPLTHSSIKQDATCPNDSTGKITMNISGGTFPFSGTFDNGQTFEGRKAGDNFAQISSNGLPAGNYTIYAQDRNGCISSPETIEIIDPDDFEVFTNINDVTCFGMSNGTIVGSTSGATSPYSFSLSNGDVGSTFNFNSLDVGNYTYLITDALSCTFSDTFSIDQPEELELSSQSDSITCWGDGDGNIVLNATGGTEPYQYNMNGNGFSTENNFSNLDIGAYQFMVRDQNNCRAFARDTVYSPLQINVNSVLSNVDCYGDSTGSILLNVFGGNSNFQYQWEHTNINSNFIQNYPAGSYHVTIIDDKNCQLEDDFEILQPQSQLIGNIQNTESTCAQIGDGSLKVIASGGTFPYSYIWNDINNQTTEEIFGLFGNQWYEVQIIDNNNCEAEASTFLNAQHTFSVEQDPIYYLCPNQEKEISITANIDSISWGNSNIVLSEDPVFTLAKEGEYWVKGTDSLGCVESDTFEVVISENTLSVNFLAQSLSTKGDSIVIIDYSSPKPEAYSWNWGGGTVVDTAYGHPVIVFPEDSDTINISLTASLGSCIKSKSKEIIFYDQADFPLLPQDTLFLGVNEITSVKLYPNPNNGQFTLEAALESVNSLEVIITDTFGEMKAQQFFENSNFYAHQFSIDGLSEGVYVLKVVTQNDFKIITFIVI